MRKWKIEHTEGTNVWAIYKWHGWVKGRWAWWYDCYSLADAEAIIKVQSEPKKVTTEYDKHGEPVSYGY